MKNNTPFNVLKHINQWEVAPKDPATVAAVGNFVLGAIGITGASVATATIVGYVTIAVVSSALTAAAVLSQLPDMNQGGANNSGTLLKNNVNPLSTSNFIYGEVRKGGTVTFMEVTGVGNKILHQVIALAHHEVEEIGDIYFNDEIVTMSNEDVTSDPYVGFVKVYKHLGNQTSASDTFANSSATLANTLQAETSAGSDFIGKGVAYIYARYTYDKDAYTNGLPTITAQVKGKKVVKTVNGVAQTAAYSNNAAWCIKDYLQSSYGLGDDAINYATFEAAAAICDDTTILSDGTPQFTMNGIVTGSDSHGNILEKMMTTCGGTLFWGAGSWRIYAGDFVAPTKTLTLDDFRSAISLDTKSSMRDNFNAIRGTFVDAGNDFISADYPQINSQTFLNEDNGVETVLDLNLPFTTNVIAAQRIAKQLLYRSREQLTMSADFGMNAFDVEVGDFVKIRNERYGWATGDEKIFEVSGWRLQPDPKGLDLRVNLTLRESSEAAFGFSEADEQAIVSNNTTLLKYYDVPSIGVSVSQEYREVNENVVNVLVVTVISSAIERVESVILKYKKTSDTEFKSVGQTILINEGSDAGRFEIVGIKAPQISEQAINYTVSVTPVNAVGFRGSAVTTTYNLTADTVPPSVPASLSHLLSGGTIFFEWPAVSDLDLSHYKLYYSSNSSANFTDSSVLLKVSKIARPATSITFAALAGKFFITSVDKTGNESATATSTVVLASELPQLGIATTQSEETAFSGAKSNVTASGGSLTLTSFSSSGATGTYDFDHNGNSYIDVGTSRTVRLSSAIVVARKHSDAVGGEINWDDIPQNWDTWPNNFNTWTDEDAEFHDFNVLIQARSAATSSGLSSASFIDASGEIVGRFIEFRAILSNSNPKITPNITALSATVEY